LHSALVEIPGIGEASARMLLGRFGSVAILRKATVEELVRVVSRAQAQRLVEFLHEALPPRHDL